MSDNTIRLINYSPEIRKELHKSMVNKFKKQQMEKGVPKNFAEANIKTLLQMASVGKPIGKKNRSFFNILAKKGKPHALPPIVEEEILEYLGVKRGQSTKEIIKTVKNIRKKANENRRRAELQKQWAPIVELLEEAEKEQKKKTSKLTRRLTRKKQVEKSRLRRGKTNKVSTSKYENRIKMKTRKNRNKNNNNNNNNLNFNNNNIILNNNNGREIQ